MKRLIAFITIAATLLFVGAAAAKPVGDMPMVDGTMCVDPTTGGAPYFQSGEYYPNLVFNFYAWVYPNGYLREYRWRWDNYTLVCEYQSVAGRLAWVSTVG